MPHVIWDWNGTLLDDFPIVLDAVNVSLRSIGAPAIDGDGYRTHFTRPVRGFYAAVLGRDIDDALMAEINEAFFGAYEPAVELVGLTPDARGAIDAVAARGASQSVASMSPHHILVSEVRRFGLDDAMIAVDGQRGVLRETKEQHLVEHLGRLDRLYPGLDGMTVIGDSIDDARAARSAGVACVLYDGGSHFRSDLEAIGVPVAGTLLDAVALALD